MQSGEFVETNLSSIFADFADGNYALKSGSRAIDAGVSAPVSNDIAGISRPQGLSYDIGAYEYATGGSDTTAPAAPSGLSVQ